MVEWICDSRENVRLAESGTILTILFNSHLGYSECTPTSATPASSLHAFDNVSRLPAQGVFIEPGIDNVDTGLRS